MNQTEPVLPPLESCPIELRHGYPECDCDMVSGDPSCTKVPTHVEVMKQYNPLSQRERQLLAQIALTEAVKKQGHDLAQAVEKYRKMLDDAITQRDALLARVETLEGALNSPETEDFDKGVPLEAGHQVIRWGVEHDAGKQPEDWFWLCGYLAGKALSAAKSGDTEKAKHHCISTAAMMRNWHRAISTGQSVM